MKYLIGVAFILILGALGSAALYMLRGGRGDEARSKNMARALALRVALSVLVFALILLSYAMGWIEPTGIRVGR